jgi:TrmH family RNA methyltransferase
MLSKAQNKYIRSLTQHKYRNEYTVFIAEGDKIAAEWLATPQPVQMIVALPSWAEVHSDLIQRHPEAEVYIVKEHELESVSALQTPNKVLLVVPIPTPEKPVLKKEWCLVLDEIQDPGNMGTIIRIADWFGIKHIICSEGCVDVYNPKVVQAAMGSHLRVKFHTADLSGFIAEQSLPVYAAALDGKNVYELKTPAPGIIIIGNESKGISSTLLAQAKTKITIPRIGAAESLNAAVSAGIICALMIGRG